MIVCTYNIHNYLMHKKIQLFSIDQYPSISDFLKNQDPEDTQGTNTREFFIVFSVLILVYFTDQVSHFYEYIFKFWASYVWWMGSVQTLQNVWLNGGTTELEKGS